MGINNITSGDQVENLLKKGLDAASERKRAIANNIANINTKGYKKYYVSFEESLKEAQGEVSLMKTDKGHIGEENHYGDIKVKQDTSSSMRLDGNNVDIDNEMANQAANTLMYNALATRINSKLALTRYIIKDGRG